MDGKTRKWVDEGGGGDAIVLSLSRNARCHNRFVRQAQGVPSSCCHRHEDIDHQQRRTYLCKIGDNTSCIATVRSGMQTGEAKLIQRSEGARASNVVEGTMRRPSKDELHLGTVYAALSEGTRKLQTNTVQSVGRQHPRACLRPSRTKQAENRC